MTYAVSNFHAALSNFTRLEDTVVYDSTNSTFIVADRESDKLYMDPRYVKGHAIRNFFENHLRRYINRLSTETLDQLSSSLNRRITKIDTPLSAEERNFLDSINNLLTKEQLHREDVIKDVLIIKDLTAMFFHKLTLSDVSAFAQTNKQTAKRSKDNSIWYGIAQKLGFNDIQMTGAAEGTIKQKVMEKYRSFCQQIRDLPPNQVPADVLALLDEKIPSVESVASLREWQKARDTLVVWEKLQNAIDSPVAISWASRKEMIQQAAVAFQTWMTNNQTQLSSLGSLSLRNKQLTSIPDAIGYLTALTFLDAGKNKLTCLPNTIEKLTALTILNLDYNQLISIPDAIEKLSALQELELNYNQLTSLPDTFGNLLALEELDLSNNKLTSLPDTFGNLHVLEYLHIQCNLLAQVLDTFGNLTALTLLNCSNNKLTSFPNTFGNLTALTILNSGDNQLAELPNTFGNLTALKSLSLSNNQLTSLPDTFGKLTALEILNFNDNQLAELPGTFGNLSKLRRFYLSKNKLTSLSDTFGKLSALEELELSNNKLTCLPAEMKNLLLLKTLVLTGNSLQPTDIPEQLRHFLKSLLQNSGSADF